jgi:hypothetical protein
MYEESDLVLDSRAVNLFTHTRPLLTATPFLSHVLALLLDVVSHPSDM